MRVRHPPGRAGRPWLAHRLAVARRGAELLEEKQRALARERTRLEPLIVQARERWERAAGTAQIALTRAAMLGGERSLQRAAVPPAAVTVRWQAVLGVRCPRHAQMDAASAPARPPAGASAALQLAVAAQREALEAAVAFAAARRAFELLDAALRATALRRAAIERRWIPAHEAALAALELALDERELEDAARVRRIHRTAS